jgi:hypothetical protein
MRILSAWPFLFALTTAAHAAGGNAYISFIQPEHFADAALYGGSGAAARAPVLSALKDYLTALAARTLAADQTLTLDILDVDLAGRYEWWVQPNGIRVLDDVSWPAVKISYVLEENGAVIRKGTETVSDLDYLTRPELASSDPLWREKAMLTDWFRKRFGARKAAQN